MDWKYEIWKAGVTITDNVSATQFSIFPFLIGYEILSE